MSKAWRHAPAASQSYMNLTEHFNLDEFHCRDGTTVPEDLVPGLTDFCGSLELVRTFFGGAPVLITSGYRTPAYNEKVGGAEKSKHVYTQNDTGVFAADIVVQGISPIEVRGALIGLIRLGIVCEGGVGLYDRWVHYDNRGTRARWVG